MQNTYTSLSESPAFAYPAAILMRAPNPAFISSNSPISGTFINLINARGCWARWSLPRAHFRLGWVLSSYVVACFQCLSERFRAKAPIACEWRALSRVEKRGTPPGGDENEQRIT